MHNNNKLKITYKRQQWDIKLLIAPSIFFGNATLDLECIDFNNCFDIEFICTKSIHANIDYEILLDILIRREYFIRLE